MMLVSVSPVRGPAAATVSGVEVRGFLDQTVERLDAAQQRAITAIRNFGDTGWTNTSLTVECYDQLVTHGHFVDYCSELQFSAQLVAGHLADSYTVFGARLKVIREMDMPSFGDFVTDDAGRIEGYREMAFADGIDRLIWTYQYLRTQITEVRSVELERIGVHEFDGEISVQDILEFLPDHVDDHVEQLRSLTVAS